MDETIRVWNATPLRGDEAQEAHTFRQSASEVWTLAVSPDGQRLATAGLSVGGDEPITIRDLRPSQAGFELRGRQSIVFGVAWHPNGRQIAASGLDLERKLFVVKVWDALNRRVDFELPAGMETFALAFSPDGEHLVTGREDGNVQVWDARTGAAVGRLGRHGRREQIRGLVFSADGRHLASASNAGRVNLWDATRLRQQQQPLRSFRGRVALAAMNLAFSPDGRHLAAGGADNTVKVWDVHTGRPEQTFTGHSGDVWATAFSPDPEGRWLASAGEDSTVKVWDSRSGTLLHSFRGHTGLVSSVAFSRDGRWLYSGSRDKTVKVWDVTQLGSEAGDR
jgi:WD40 repeat protein